MPPMTSQPGPSPALEGGGGKNAPMGFRGKYQTHALQPTGLPEPPHAKPPRSLSLCCDAAAWVMATHRAHKESDTGPEAGPMFQRGLCCGREEKRRGALVLG